MNSTSIILGQSIPERQIGFGKTAPGGSAAPQLIADDSDAGLVTIAGTGTGKGVAHVIPTALTYPGSLIVMDIKGEIAAVTARARRAMGQEVVILDPFGGHRGALNPMEAIQPASIDAPDQCRRIAQAILFRRSQTSDPFWDDMAETILAGSLLFLATHIRREDRCLPLLHRMWGVADHLDDMLAAMKSTDLHGGVMMAAAAAYTDAADRTASSILTTLRAHIAFLASPRSNPSLSGGWGVLQRLRSGVPMTIYLRVPPHMLASHAALLRIWLDTILATLCERAARPAIPDLFLVDEAAALGHLEPLLTASSLLRGYGLRVWTFWQSIRQIEGIYGARSGEFLNNAGTLSMFGASNLASARDLAEVTGYDGPILEMARDSQVLCRQGCAPVLARKLTYLSDPRYRGLYDANPLHVVSRGGARPASHSSPRRVTA